MFDRLTAMLSNRVQSSKCRRKLNTIDMIEGNNCYIVELLYAKIRNQITGSVWSIFEAKNSGSQCKDSMHSTYPLRVQLSMAFWRLVPIWKDAVKHRTIWGLVVSLSLVCRKQKRLLSGSTFFLKKNSYFELITNSRGLIFWDDV